MKFLQKYLIITICVFGSLLVLTGNVQAQSKGRNSGLDQTTFEIIKTRTSILEDFRKQNFDKVKFKRDSLRKAFENDNHLPFFPAEYWLLCFWTKDYSSILVDKFLSDTTQYNSTYVSYPVFDTMGEEVRRETRDNCRDLKKQINASSLTSKDKDFLQIVLYYAIHKNNEPKDTLQVTINEMAKKFVAENPTSPYNGMMKGHIIKEYIGLKGADEILFGGGYSMPFDKMGDYLSAGYNLSIDYRKYIGSSFVGLTANMFSGKLVDSVTVQYKSFPKTAVTDEMFNIYNIGIDLGNRFLDSKSIAMSFFGGGSYNALSITHVLDKKTNKSEQININTAAARIGLTFDFKFVKQGVYASYKKYDDFNHAKFFRLKYDYEIPLYSDKASALKGGIHNFTLSIGFNTRDIVKK